LRLFLQQKLPHPEISNCRTCKKGAVMRIFERKTDLRMLRTIIIDDEAHMRQSLEKMIGTVCGHVKIVATADGVKTGMAAIKKYHPDLIFLDIKMDDGTGFDLQKPANTCHDFRGWYATFSTAPWKSSFCLKMKLQPSKTTLLYKNSGFPTNSIIP
jgi:PleD family two-component response regulator